MRQGSSAPRRWRGQRGQTSAEYLGAILLVSVIIAALAISAPGAQIGNDIKALICKIGGGSCEADQLAKLEPCTIASSSRDASINADIAFVDLKKGGAYLREDKSDGTTKFTVTESGSAALAARVGADGEIGNYGFDASAAAAAGGELSGAKEYVVPTDKADELEKTLRKEGGLGKLVADTALDGSPVLRAGKWGFDKLTGHHDPKLPEPTSTIISAQAIAEAKAGVGLKGGPLESASLEGAIKAAGGGRLYTSGPRKGDIDLFFQLDEKASGTLTVASLGPGVSAKAKGVAVLTLKGGTTPSDLKVTVSGRYAGGSGVGEQLKGAQLGDLQKILKKASVGGVDGEGQGIEFSADLDLTDPGNLDAATGLLTDGAAGVMPLVERFNDHGTLALQFSDTTDSDFKAGGTAGVAIHFGGGFSQSGSDSKTTDALIKTPGAAGFARRECGQGADQ